MQETFQRLETLSQGCMRLSNTWKPCRRVAGDFPTLGNLAANLQETFQRLETLSQGCRRLSKPFDGLLQAGVCVLFVISVFIFYSNIWKTRN
jgi:hypothetical protein